MKSCTVKLKSISPYGQSRHKDHEHPRKDRELAKDHEERTWRHRMHVDKEGNVIIPPMAFKNCISEIPKFLNSQIPGKGKATYTKHFEAGILVLEPAVLSIKAEDVQGLWLFVPASGKRGDGKRVMKCFPVIQEWEANVTFHVLDETITRDVFEHHLREAGKFIGIGFFRPRNNGYWGRFEPVKFEWTAT